MPPISSLLASDQKLRGNIRWLLRRLYDLAQLVLGVDRDAEIVAHVFDERNPSVKTMIANVIRAVKAKVKNIGICGQAAIA